MKFKYSALTLILLFVCAIASSAQVTYRDAFPNISFVRPTDFKAPPTSSNLVFVAQKNGKIYALENDSTVNSPSLFLDLSGQVLSREEQGLFALAFHPDYEKNGYVYVHHTKPFPRRSVIARYRRDPDNPRKALKRSKQVLLELEQPHSTHNGGELEFGPDGYLYASFGDGEVSGDGDPYDNGQDRSTLHASVIRIDVDTSEIGLNYGIPDDNPFVGQSDCGDGNDPCRGEIYAYGFRNPWRFSFDPETDSLWLGDVGHNRYEEVNIIKKGQNYGWSVMEGKHCFDPSQNCDTLGLTLPVYEYESDTSRLSVTGGVVYRGSAIPSLQGNYIFADFVVGKVFYLSYSNTEGTWDVERYELFGNISSMVSFGIDREKEVYICSFDGNIYKIVPETEMAVGREGDKPESMHLYGNYPNPFNPSTTIRYYFPAATHVSIDVFNARGQKVANLIDEMESAGEHTVSFQADNLPSGIYFYQFKTPGHMQFGKMSLIK